MINYYHILGLTEDASPEEIKAAFKKLAIKYHPDKHPDRTDMEEKFKEINQAHQILCDPYEKARFDLKLKYQQFSHSQSDKPLNHSGSAQTSYHYPPYYRTKIDHRQNAIATAYAFGITFLIAALVMGGVWVKRSYESIKHEKILAERRATFEQAKKNFDSGNYTRAFEIMTEFRFFDNEELDIKKFKNSMVDHVIVQGDMNLKQKKYETAISQYNLVFNLNPSLPFYNVKKKLVLAYKNLGEVDKALEILKDFLVNDYELIASLVGIAEIHRDYLNDPGGAMENFQLAHKLVVKRYKRFYGEAYPMVIRQEFVPESHYLLYIGLADMYLRINNPNMAIKAADWNKYVWPDSISSYTTTAEAYIALNDLTKACLEFQIAEEKGWQGIPPIKCTY
ncbi:MAG: DnaJ domain-containing protein [Bacteroidota bacterium]